MLAPAVHRGKNTTQKTLHTPSQRLETMSRDARAWPQQCWKSCANGSFDDHGKKELLGAVGLKV